MENFILWLQSLLIGMVQGFTEPLPISSSGHVVILRTLWNDAVSDLSLEIFLNSASFLAVLFVLRKEIFMLLKDVFEGLKKKDVNEALTMSMKIVVGSVPIIVIGLFFRDIVEEWLSANSLLTVGIGLLFTSALLLMSHFVSKRSIPKPLSLKSSFLIGVSQVIAIIPGISRSGMTFSAGILNKIDKKQALTYSMYLYLVVSFGSLVLSLNEFRGFLDGYGLTAFVASFVMTVISLKWFYRILEKNRLIIFSLYCLFVGIITLGLASLI